MSPLNITLTLSPATSRVIVAGKDSVPAMAPAGGRLGYGVLNSALRAYADVF